MHRRSRTFFDDSGHEHGTCDFVLEIFRAGFGLKPRVVDALIADRCLHVFFGVRGDWSSTAHLKQWILHWGFLLSLQPSILAPSWLVFQVAGGVRDSWVQSLKCIGDQTVTFHFSRWRIVIQR